MKEYNILILSVGRRVELVQRFQNAVKNLNLKSHVIGADASDTAPGLFFSDKQYIIPRIGHPNYINSIIDIANQENVKLIIPTIDTELLILSENKKYIEEKTSALVLISNKEVISICRDKIKTQKYLEKHGFLIPKSYDIDNLQYDNLLFPLFIKPKSGSSSVNTFKVNNKDELESYLKLIEDPILQDYMDGKEYTVDVFIDFDGNIISVVPRERMVTRSGEISKGKITKDKEIIEDVVRLIKLLKPIGQITIQLMKTKKGIEYIEINPRFGGGAPMSIDAGANSCENLFLLLQHKKLEYNDNWEDGVIFVRFDQSVRIN